MKYFPAALWILVIIANCRVFDSQAWIFNMEPVVHEFDYPYSEASVTNTPPPENDISGDYATEADYLDYNYDYNDKDGNDDGDDDDKWWLGDRYTGLTETMFEQSLAESGDGQETDSQNHKIWSQWTVCSVTCGQGDRKRGRVCGDGCRQAETEDCFLPPCIGVQSSSDTVRSGTVGNGTSHVYNQATLMKPQTGHTTTDAIIDGITNLLQGFVHGAQEHTIVEHQYHEIHGDTADLELKDNEEQFLNPEEDACEMWTTCDSPLLAQYVSALTDLPACPCYLPVNLYYDNEVFDMPKFRYFQWVDVNKTAEHLSIYKPDADHCIRSLLEPGAETLASQVCCYDNINSLITQGHDAGTPNFISPEISWELHQKVDILPWVICKGDWSRYNQVFKPNNVLQCRENPARDVLLQQVEDIRIY